MKNKILPLIISLLLTQFLMAQNENKVAKVMQELKNDTAIYLKQLIIARKDSYIGKPLDSLVKNLPGILRYANGVVHRNRNISPDMTLYFSSSGQVLDKLAKKEFPLLLAITWATPLDNRELPSLGLKSFGGEWTEAAYNYYKDKIIGKIETVRYGP